MIEKKVDSRSELLEKIREGKKLKKVERRTSAVVKPKDPDNFEDVMKHVMDLRYNAIHDTDSEEEEWSDDGMFEENNFD